MKLFTIIFVLLIGFLAACSPKNELSGIEGFDIDLLTREDGWQIDSVCTVQLVKQLLTENDSWEKQMNTKYAKNEPVLKSISDNIKGRALMMAFMVEFASSKKNKKIYGTPIYIKQDTNNYISLHSAYTKGDTLHAQLTTFQNKAATIYTDKETNQSKSIQLIKNLNNDELLVEFAILTTPKDSLDPVFKLSEQEHYMPYWRLCLKPKK